MDDKIEELADTQVVELGINSLKRLSCFAIIDNINLLNPIIGTLPTVLRDNLSDEILQSLRENQQLFEEYSLPVQSLQSVRESNVPLFSVLSR